jgi:hypothetical protein
VRTGYKYKVQRDILTHKLYHKPERQLAERERAKNKECTWSTDMELGPPLLPASLHLPHASSLWHVWACVLSPPFARGYSCPSEGGAALPHGSVLYSPARTQAPSAAHHALPVSGHSSVVWCTGLAASPPLVHPIVPSLRPPPLPPRS